MGINYLAAVMAALVAFVGSFLWYIIFGHELATASTAFAQAQKESRQPWKMLFVLLKLIIISVILGVWR